MLWPQGTESPGISTQPCPATFSGGTEFNFPLWCFDCEARAVLGHPAETQGGTRWKQVQNLSLQARDSTPPPAWEQWRPFGQDDVMPSGSLDAHTQGPLLGHVVSSRLRGHGMYQLLSP